MKVLLSKEGIPQHGHGLVLALMHKGTGFRHLGLGHLSLLQVNEPGESSL